MKFEIEIKQEEIEASILPKLKRELSEQISGYAFTEFLKSEIKKRMILGLGEMIDEQLKDSENIKKKIQSEIEVKIKNQLTQLMKVKS